MEVTALAIAGALITAVGGACANWIARPKWAEQHPRRLLAAVAGLAVAGALVTITVDRIAGAESENAAPAPGTVSPSMPPVAGSAPKSGVPTTSPLDGTDGFGGGAVPPADDVDSGGGSPVGVDDPPSTPSLRVVTASLPVAEVGVRWTAELTASGGTPAYRWAVGDGALPTGFVLQQGGQLNGTPQEPEPRTFELVVTDRMGVTATKRFTIDPRPRRSDITRDGPVDCADKAVLQSQWNQTGPDLSGDLNGDDAVNITDLSIMMSDWTGASGSC